MEGKLKKEISLFGALTTVMGTVIGGGVFFKASMVVQQTHSASLSLFAWVFGGVLTICGGLTVAELATAIPVTGGPIKYIEAAYGKMPSFLLGWAQTLIYFPANIAALSIIFSNQLLNLFRLPAHLLIPIALLTACTVTGINLLGTKAGAVLQSFTLVIKLVPIALIVAVGLFQKGNAAVSLFPVAAGKGVGFAEGLSGALLATLFAYDGWLGIGAMAGEMKRPKRDLPKAIVLGLSLVTVVYALTNFVYLKTLPADLIAGNLNTASDTAMKLFGSFGGRLITIGILVSVYGAVNGYTMTGIRVPYAMAEKNLLPFSRHFKKLSKNFRIPYICALFQLGVAFIMMLLGNFDMLTDMLVFVMWLFSVLMFIAVFILRKRQPDLPRPYKVPLYPVIPVLAIGGAMFILIMTMITQTGLALTGIGITLAGIPVYLWQKRRAPKETEGLLEEYEDEAEL